MSASRPTAPNRDIAARLSAGFFAAFAVFAAWCGPASAATPSIATANVNLRAGPSTAYPAILVVPKGARVVTYGCVKSFAWCDVGYGRARGWVASAYITATFDQRAVTVTAATAAAVGIGVVAFSRAYWEAHYQAYPWYGSWTLYHRRVAPPAYRGPVVTRGAAGCVGNACGAARAVAGPYGGRAVRGGTCADGTCTGGRVVVGPGGRAAGGAATCTRGVGCEAVRFGPRGGTVQRSLTR